LHPAHLDEKPDTILVSFEDRGRIYWVVIRSKDFAAIANAMMRTNAEEAIKAFGSALQDGTPEQIKDTGFTLHVINKHEERLREAISGEGHGGPTHDARGPIGAAISRPT
jgi:hypothetical protein